MADCDRIFGYILIIIPLLTACELSNKSAPITIPHEDMRANFAAYPKDWNLTTTDRNIDHRRVPNLMVFFKREGKSLPVTRDAANYQPGDLVTWDLGGGESHIGIVSNVRSRLGRLAIVHNIGAGTRLEDVLFNWQIIGHYRYF